MKKVLLVFGMSAMVMTFATVKAEGDAKQESQVVAEISMAENIEANSADCFKIRLRLRDLNKAMHLGADQVEGLQFTSNDLSRRVAQLEKVPEGQRQAMLRSIVAENLAQVREIVDAEQYRCYVAFLNAEFNKAGLSEVLFHDHLLAMK